MAIHARIGRVAQVGTRTRDMNHEKSQACGDAKHEKGNDSPAGREKTQSEQIRHNFPNKRHGTTPGLDEEKQLTKAYCEDIGVNVKGFTLYCTLNRDIQRISTIKKRKIENIRRHPQ
jgi:hypothetical protein